MAAPTLQERALAWGLSSIGGDAIQRAHVQAMQALAAKHDLGTKATGAWAYTATSCGGPYPDEKDTPPDLRWWNANTNQCVLAMPMGLDFCAKAGSLDWIPDPDSGVAICKVTASYCNSKGLNYVDDDCETTFTTFLLEQVFGATLARGLHYITENPEEALEGAVNGAMAAAEQAGRPLAPAFEAIDSVAQKLGISPYTSAAKQAVVNGISTGWQRSGAVALRGIGGGIRKFNELQAQGFGKVADGVRDVTDRTTDCINTDCGHVREGLITAVDLAGQGHRAIVSGIRQVPGGDAVVTGVNDAADALGYPAVRQWIGGPAGRDIKQFGQGMGEGFKMTGGWVMDGIDVGKEYTEESISQMRDLLQIGGSAVGGQLTAAQKAVFGGIGDAGKDVGNTLADTGKDVGNTLADTGKSTGNAFVDAGRSVGSVFGF